MSKMIFERLEAYYATLGEVLNGKAKLASIHLNTSDIGLTREDIYEKILSAHLPSCCNVYKGGFLFDQNGNESKQIDLIITMDRALQFNYNQESTNKAIACIDGCVGVASIKSTLDSKQLIDSLHNIASIPDKCPPNFSPLFTSHNYDAWPFKIIYASDGVSVDTAIKTLNNFYQENSQIPFSKRPDIIHVLGKYILILIGSKNLMDRKGALLKPNEYHVQTTHSDAFAFLYVFTKIQNIAECMNHMLYSYDWLLDRLPLK